MLTVACMSAHVAAALCASRSQFTTTTATPNLYVQQRNGSILARGMGKRKPPGHSAWLLIEFVVRARFCAVLKSDRFPAAEERPLDVHVNGAPNFRQV